MAVSKDVWADPDAVDASFTRIFLPALAQQLESAADRLERLALECFSDDDAEARSCLLAAEEVRQVAAKHKEAAGTGSLDAVYRTWFATDLLSAEGTV